MLTDTQKIMCSAEMLLALYGLWESSEVSTARSAEKHLTCLPNLGRSAVFEKTLKLLWDLDISFFLSFSLPQPHQ